MVCYLLSYPGKRSIHYPAQGKPCNISPPLERRDLWDVSVDGSPYTVVRAYPTFDPNPGDCDEILLSVEFVTVGFLRISRYSCCG